MFESGTKNNTQHCCYTWVLHRRSTCPHWGYRNTEECDSPIQTCCVKIHVSVLDCFEKIGFDQSFTSQSAEAIYWVDEKTISFTSSTHMSLSQKNMLFFGQKSDEWCVCITTDNCKTYYKIALDCSNAMIGCYSHKLSQELNVTTRGMKDQDRELALIQVTVEGAESKLESEAMLIRPSDTTH